MKALATCIDGEVSTCGPLNLQFTETTFERMRGLLARPQLEANQAMVLRSCNMVHTFGMRYPIDVVFVNKAGAIQKLCATVQPRRIRGCLSARHVVELAAGEVQRRGWKIGTQINFLSDTP